MTLRIVKGRIVDPASGRDEHADLHIAGDAIASAGKAGDGEAEEFDASGCIVMPGVIDLCARLREPGAEHKATLQSETSAALHCGITTLCVPPDTDPVVDEAATVELLHRLARNAQRSDVLPIGALTQGLKGERLAEMGALKEAGCIGVSNAWQPIGDTRVMRRACEYAATHDLLLFAQVLDPWLSKGGCANEGPVATRLGLAGVPVAAETVALAQLLELVATTGVRAHIGQVSSARAVGLIRAAKASGLPVSADVAVHHLHLTENDLLGFNSLCHVRPPLRSQRDQDALLAAALDGTVDAICSDHQPHEPDAKLAPFPSTEPGISGLDTLLKLTLKLIQDERLTLNRGIELLTSGPAGVLATDRGTLREGARADVCIVEAQALHEVTFEQWHSSGRNTPFAGWMLPGDIKACVLAGRLHRF